MDQSNEINLTISTQNVNGFKRNKDFLRSLCDQNPYAIRAIQEHWLRPPYKKQSGVNEIRSLHPDFEGFGTSAMKHSAESRILKGRPYGGTGFLFNKKLSHCVKPLVKYDHERVTVVRLETSTVHILLINVYFPFFNTRELASYLALYRDTVGYVDNIIEQNPNCKYMILADFNCNIYDTTHPYSKIMREFMERHHMFMCYDIDCTFDHKSAFTRCDEKTNSHTLIDGILISNDLWNLVSNVRISMHGDNSSDHCPVEIDLKVTVAESKFKKTNLPLYINWKKLSEADVSRFEDEMHVQLSSINVPYHTILHGYKCCLEDNHKVVLEQYYCDIMSAVIRAESVLPKTNPNYERSFWDEELTELKSMSIECNNNWKSLGCPKTGQAYECRKNCHYQYKSELRRKKKSTEKRFSDALQQDLLKKDGVSFWKSWKKISHGRDSTATRINGATDSKEIAETFASYFESVYGNHDTPEHREMKRKFDQSYSQYFADHLDDNIMPYLLSWSEMTEIVAKIKLGKSSSGVCKPEHVLYGSPTLICHLHLLFNGLIQHGFVPTDFLKGTITPIVKNTQGDLSDPSNYRGITLSCLPAKLFEFAIQLKTSHLLDTDNLQFGFKRKTSANHALFSLKSTINHFNQKGSSVYVAFLDCSKAFDRISHYGLFSKLMQRKVPLCILMCLIFWYLNMTCCVKWADVYSRDFRVPLGIKQGGINSPEFFGCYIDGIASILRKANIGCHMFGLFLAMILFADDLCLLAPTRGALNRMIQLCADYCKEYGLAFNPKKFKILVFS